METLVVVVMVVLLLMLAAWVYSIYRNTIDQTTLLREILKKLSDRA